jgi:hypothetical protein
MVFLLPKKMKMLKSPKKYPSASPKGLFESGIDYSVPKSNLVRYVIFNRYILKFQVEGWQKTVVELWKRVKHLKI